jgi:hypothetical protein
MDTQKASGYNKRSRVEPTIGRYKQVIGDGLRSRLDGRLNDRGSRRHSCTEPDAEAGTPDFRPHRIKADGVARA